MDPSLLRQIQWDAYLLLLSVPSPVLRPGSLKPSAAPPPPAAASGWPEMSGLYVMEGLLMCRVTQGDYFCHSVSKRKGPVLHGVPPWLMGKDLWIPATIDLMFSFFSVKTLSEKSLCKLSLPPQVEMNTAPLGLADHTECSQAEAAGLGGRVSWFLDSFETQPLTVVMTYAGAAATTHSRTGALRAGPEHAHIPFSQEEPADTSWEVGLEQETWAWCSFLGLSSSCPQLPTVPILSLHHGANVQGPFTVEVYSGFATRLLS